MKYYLIAGERSGDLHASHLMGEIKKNDALAEFRFFGGDEMTKHGGEPVVHYREMSFMGFWEVFTNLFTILGFLKKCKKDLLSYNPDVVILVDYAGFNLKIAKYAKEHGMNVHYYISPKIWAWNQKRALKIKAYVDHMYAILPFEKEFYKKFDYKIDFVGNPTVEEIENFKPDPQFRSKYGLENAKIIAVLPGSRKQEIERTLHLMMSITNVFADYHFVVAAVDNLSKEYFEQFQRGANVTIVWGETYNVLANAEAAVVTSGTATLETCIFNVPQVVCYKMSWLSATIVKMIIKIKYVSLVNLIANREVVRELLQENFTPHNIKEELRTILSGEGRVKMLASYEEIRKELGTKKAAESAALLINQYLTK